MLLISLFVVRVPRTFSDAFIHALTRLPSLVMLIQFRAKNDMKLLPMEMDFHVDVIFFLREAPKPI